MAVSFVDSTTNGAGSGTAVQVTKPTGLQVDDVVIVVVHANGPQNTSDNNGAQAFTSILANREYNGPSAQYDIFYRVIDGNEGATFDFTLDGSNRWSVIASAYRGVDTSDIFDVAPTASTENLRPNGDGDISLTNDITTTVDGAMIIAVAFNDSSTVTFTATPGDSFNSRENNSGEQLIALADKLKASAGLQSAVSWTQSAENGVWANNIFALNPEAAVAAPSVTTNDATNVGLTSATLNGNVTDDNGDEVTERGFYYSTSPSVDTGDTKVTTAGTTGVYDYDLSGLSENTTYYFKAFATNGEGTTLGSEKNFTTKSSLTAYRVMQIQGYLESGQFYQDIYLRKITENEDDSP